ncbi:hypothetical protein HYQ45_013150 [Verticillium longisporum]|uniref:Uncharacterized protein n=1 Tax=Verticillium longisporum TaxID=100787 RepID=A0A8I3AJQ6_VERLO|nr:hypothetical protein HYQ45_013150 [Verticillium longisporum]
MVHRSVVEKVGTLGIRAQAGLTQVAEEEDMFAQDAEEDQSLGPFALYFAPPFEPWCTTPPGHVVGGYEPVDFVQH